MIGPVLIKLGENHFEFNLGGLTGEVKTTVTADFKWDKNPGDERDVYEHAIIKSVNKIN